MTKRTGGRVMRLPLSCQPSVRRRPCTVLELLGVGWDGACSGAGMDHAALRLPHGADALEPSLLHLFPLCSQPLLDPLLTSPSPQNHRYPNVSAAWPGSHRHSRRYSQELPPPRRNPGCQKTCPHCSASRHSVPAARQSHLLGQGGHRGTEARDRTPPFLCASAVLLPPFSSKAGDKEPPPPALRWRL